MEKYELSKLPTLLPGVQHEAHGVPLAQEAIARPRPGRPQERRQHNGRPGGADQQEEPVGGRRQQRQRRRRQRQLLTSSGRLDFGQSTGQGGNSIG